MIDLLTISNFKSYEKASLPLAPLTLLIGANASGKSNVIEALRFLTWLAHGRRLEDILESVRQDDLSIRGKVGDVLYDRYDQEKGPVLGFGCTWSGQGTRKLAITIGMPTKTAGMRVIDESITGSSSSVPFYEIKYRASDYRHEVEVAYNNFARGGTKPLIWCSDRQAVFTQLDIPSRFNNKEARKIIPQVVTELQNTLRQIVFLDPNPRAMTEYSFMEEKLLQADGKNLSSVLFDLCETQQRKAQVLEFIQALPEQIITDIKFIETPRREVMVQLTETFGNQDTDREAPLLSDGTLRVLAIAAALLSAPVGGLVVIEEIDNGIHPSRAKSLLDSILTASKRSNLRVLLTSHNPALLDTLPKEAVPAVVCCYRDPTRGDSRLVRLADLTDYSELVARGPLGQLMTKGLLDRYLKSQRTPEQKAEQAQEWLRQLQLSDAAA